MKNNYVWALAALLAFTACQPEPAPQKPSDTDETPDEPAVVELTAPVLSADVTTVDLDAASDATAVLLSWTSAGEGASYKIEVGTATPSVIPVDALERAITHKEMASFGDAPFTVTFKIKASALGKKDVWSNGVQVQVKAGETPPEPPAPTYPTRLFIYFWAWEDATHAQEMTRLSDGVFSWTGDCVPWQFKFLTANGKSEDYGTGYSRDPKAADYWTMMPTVGGDDPTFELNHDGLAAGQYTITADLTTMKVSYVKHESPLPERLFIDTWAWGDGTKAREMTALGDGKFTWEGVLPRANIKFTTSNASPDDYWTGYFRDPDASDYWTLKETGTQVMFDVEHDGFRDGWFTVNVDLNTLKAEVIPHLWLIGAGCDAGWELNKAEEFAWDSTARTFTWTGQMYQGPFKFLVVNTDWYGYWRNSTEDNYWLAGENDAGDPQFDIAHDGLEAGVYTVTFHLDTKAVTVKQ